LFHVTAVSPFRQAVALSTIRTLPEFCCTQATISSLPESCALATPPTTAAASEAETTATAAREWTTRRTGKRMRLSLRGRPGGWPGRGPGRAW
jgi:hypothetical protein